jgi:hypothetical protein
MLGVQVRFFFSQANIVVLGVTDPRILIQHFYIYDWESTDTSWHVYRHYMELGIVRHHFITFSSNAFRTDFDDTQLSVIKWRFPWDHIHFQPGAQNQCLYKYGPHFKFVVHFCLFSVMGDPIAFPRSNNDEISQMAPVCRR